MEGIKRMNLQKNENEILLGDNGQKIVKFSGRQILINSWSSWAECMYSLGNFNDGLQLVPSLRAVNISVEVEITKDF